MPGVCFAGFPPVGTTCSDMSQQATDLPVTVPAPPSPSEAEALTRSAEAIAAVLAAGGTRDGACAALAHEACRLLNWKRCSIFVRDDETGAYVGRLSFRTDRTDSDARVARVVCATAADRFAQEVISTRWPLLIRDAQNDPRPVRAAMVRWGVRTILGVPLLAADEVVGLLFVDDPDVLRDYDTQAASN